jgi:hypothetical protein
MNCERAGVKRRKKTQISVRFGILFGILSEDAFWYTRREDSVQLLRIRPASTIFFTLLHEIKFNRHERCIIIISS